MGNIFLVLAMGRVLCFVGYHGSYNDTAFGKLLTGMKIKWQ
jgi:hypothetical protein